ncbi:hypothetical protein HPB49_016033 [Dermacentor silvarum]|uniref:Uncharacterized protein n=1 Tax=Dermacentor silvarum TaxID=543639 RepID=A0ACB8CG07_DERSI|nr:hypothetical protein HPB49_016033 [Dermacentor silvarum]
MFLYHLLPPRAASTQAKSRLDALPKNYSGIAAYNVEMDDFDGSCDGAKKFERLGVIREQIANAKEPTSFTYALRWVCAISETIIIEVLAVAGPPQKKKAKHRSGSSSAHCKHGGGITDVGGVAVGPGGEGGSKGPIIVVGIVLLLLVGGLIYFVTSSGGDSDVTGGEDAGGFGGSGTDGGVSGGSPPSELPRKPQMKLERKRQLWNELATLLNAEGPARKTAEQWQLFWRKEISLSDRDAAAVSASQSTGGGGLPGLRGHILQLVGTSMLTGVHIKLVCTFGMTGVLESQIPPDKMCDFIFYTHMYYDTKRKAIIFEYGDTAGSQFTNAAKSYTSTTFGASLAVSLRPAYPPAEKDNIKKAMENLMNDKIMHFGTLNVDVRDYNAAKSGGLQYLKASTSQQLL